MAKIRKSRLNWESPEAAQVTGYRLYWTTGTRLSYDSSFIDLGMVNEVHLPDILKDVPHAKGPVLLAVTSVDVNGNESDMVLLSEPYHLDAPPAPAGFGLTPLDDFEVVGTNDSEASKQFDSFFEEDKSKEPPSDNEPPAGL